MHEHVFQAGLRRGQLVQPPVLSAGAGHQRGGGVDVGREADEEAAVAPVFDGRDAVDAAQRFDGGRPVQTDGDGAAALELAQAGDGVAEHDFAVMQNLHAVADRFNLGEDVCRQDHAVRAAEFADQCANVEDLVGIEPDGRFVENDQIGLVHNGLGDADTLLVALGQGADQFPRYIGEAAALHGTRDGLFTARARHAVQSRGQPQIFSDVQFPVQRRCFREIADPCFGRDRLIHQVNAADADFTGAGGEVTGEHLHGGGFAGAVGPEQAQHLPVANFQVKPADCGVLAVEA